MDSFIERSLSPGTPLDSVCHVGMRRKTGYFRHRREWPRTVGDQIKAHREPPSCQACLNCGVSIKKRINYIQENTPSNKYTIKNRKTTVYYYFKRRFPGTFYIFLHSDETWAVAHVSQCASRFWRPIDLLIRLKRKQFRCFLLQWLFGLGKKPLPWSQSKHQK